jgi:enoyl-CoA hydratase/carnithine racemase
VAYKYTKVHREGPITVVTINRPEVLNALHFSANAELDSIFDEFASDPAQWVGIITGEGERAFSAGNDLKYQAASGEMNRLPNNGVAGLTSRFDLSKPLIAAVNGIAMGGGFEIALACDVIVASEKAVFSLPEPRVGLAALGGGVNRLPAAIGIKRAMEIILTSRRVSAEEGKTLGFVNEVVAQGGVLDAARRVASEICQGSPLAVRASKVAAMAGIGRDLRQTLAEHSDRPEVRALLMSEDLIEGPLAFSQKRPPKWQGR